MSQAHSEPLNGRTLAWQLGSAVVLALVIGSWTYLSATEEEPPPWERMTSITTLTPESAVELEEVYVEVGYPWPPGLEVPGLSVAGFPADMAEQQPAERKALFYRILLPLVLVENQRMEAKRLFVKTRLGPGVQPEQGSRDAAWLAHLVERYRVDSELPPAALQARLLRRIDGLPVGLILVQAANESGWGTSRFVREANNLFGVWTYTEGAGLRPSAADDEARHSVRTYENLQASVRGYLYNINVGHGYKALRSIRADARANGERLRSADLAAGLTRYSERGEAYVAELRSMLAFDELPSMRLGERTIIPCERVAECDVQPLADRTHQSRLNQ